MDGRRSCKPSLMLALEVGLAGSCGRGAPGDEGPLRDVIGRSGFLRALPTGDLTAEERQLLATEALSKVDLTAEMNRVPSLGSACRHEGGRGAASSRSRA